eukprot:gene14798-8527_t
MDKVDEAVLAGVLSMLGAVIAVFLYLRFCCGGKAEEEKGWKVWVPDPETRPHPAYASRAYHRRESAPARAPLGPNGAPAGADAATTGWGQERRAAAAVGANAPSSADGDYVGRRPAPRPTEDAAADVLRGTTVFRDMRSRARRKTADRRKRKFE